MLTLALLVACGAPATSYITAASAPPERSIAVSGTVRVELVPDESCIELTLSARSPMVSTSHEELTTHVSSLLEALSDNGALRVERGAIRYAPTYSNHRSGEPRHITSHVATANINVRTQDFDQIPEVIAQAATHGLERVGVVFYSTELVERKAAIRRQALETARDKASDMATTLGTSIGAVVSIRESGTSTSAPLALANRVNMVVPQPTDSAPSLPAQPGSIPLTVSVDVVYALGD